MIRVCMTACIVMLCVLQSAGQGLPRGLSDSEKQQLAQGFVHKAVRLPGEYTRTGEPPRIPRSPAEWEELQAIMITWTNYPAILTEIVRHAKEEVRVIIVTTNENSVRNTLQNAGINLSHNVEFVNADFNSVWIRDYGANPAYLYDVDSLILIDWIYNRPRPRDDVIPYAIASHLGVPIYATMDAPDDLVNTGGNFMSDGHGRGFSSNLVLTENGPGNVYGTSNHSAGDIDDIMYRYMGIDEYVKMTVLPFDGIHHIDMHMKLLDESSLLVGQYPEGIADGPQIEANLQYVITQFKQITGRDYRVIRIPMPPDHLGRYPHQGGHYRTYANAILINKTVLVPVYAEQYDTTALRIWREAKPGHKVVGINCNQIIPASGALHCIIKEVSAPQPLWISHHQPEMLPGDQPQILGAGIVHAHGVASAHLFYRNEGSAQYDSLEMLPEGNEYWSATLPTFDTETTVEYYFKATAVSGKTQVRPMPAPDGYFRVLVGASSPSNTTVSRDALTAFQVFPNPASAITCVPVELDRALEGRLQLYDLYGRPVLQLFAGTFPQGESMHFFDANALLPGFYILEFASDAMRMHRPVVIK